MNLVASNTLRGKIARVVLPRYELRGQLPYVTLTAGYITSTPLSSDSDNSTSRLQLPAGTVLRLVDPTQLLLGLFWVHRGLIMDSASVKPTTSGQLLDDPTRSKTSRWPQPKLP